MSRRPNARGSRFNADDCKEKACAQEGQAGNRPQGCREEARAQVREKAGAQNQAPGRKQGVEKAGAQSSEKTCEASYCQEGRARSNVGQGCAYQAAVSLTGSRGFFFQWLAGAVAISVACTAESGIGFVLSASSAPGR
jgi:hypothetical protein